MNICKHADTCGAKTCPHHGPHKECKACLDACVFKGVVFSPICEPYEEEE